MPNLFSTAAFASALCAISASLCAISSAVGSLETTSSIFQTCQSNNDTLLALVEGGFISVALAGIK